MMASLESQKLTDIKQIQRSSFRTQRQLFEPQVSFASK